MNVVKQAEELEKTRRFIAQKVRDLRKARHWTQSELSKRLHIAQGHLSEIERGHASLTAEQFLLILRVFNQPASFFVSHRTDETLAVQNALARLGAVHLHETEEITPSEARESDVVREALVAGSPRVITALAPVLVLNVNRFNLKKLDVDLAEAGLQRRFGWLLENTLEALRLELERSPPRVWAKRYRRAEVLLAPHLELIAAREASDSRKRAPDILDPGIRSKQTVDEVRASSSRFSQRWEVITDLQPADFVHALREARATH